MATTHPEWVDLSAHPIVDALQDAPDNGMLQPNSVSSWTPTRALEGIPERRDAAPIEMGLPNGDRDEWVDYGPEEE